MTGWPPPECPWRAINDPLMIDVYRVRAALASGMGEALVGGDWGMAPRALVEALVQYDKSLAASQAYVRRREQERDKNKPSGVTGGESPALQAARRSQTSTRRNRRR